MGCLRPLRNLALFGLLAAIAMSAPAADPAQLRCTLGVPAQAASGKPVPLRLTIANTGREEVHVLIWGTPFEGWFAPFVVVRHDGKPLEYLGPTVKRGDPAREEYVRIEAGRARSKSINLDEAFDLSQPGQYRVEPRIVLHDVVVDGQALIPRRRAQHVALPLNCDPVKFEVRSTPR